MSDRRILIVEAFVALVGARRVRRRGSLRHLRIPHVRGARPPTPGEVRRAVRWADRAARVGGAGGDRKCFLRACVLATLLRRRGVAVELNVGMSADTRRPEGHCWLSLDGRPFAEPEDPGRRYPVHVATCARGVRYWAGGPH